MGCDNSEAVSWHEEAAMDWDEPEHQAQVAELLEGEEPC